MLNLTRITRLKSEGHRQNTMNFLNKRQSTLKISEKNKISDKRPSLFFLENQKTPSKSKICKPHALSAHSKTPKLESFEINDNKPSSEKLSNMDEFKRNNINIAKNEIFLKPVLKEFEQNSINESKENEISNRDPVKEILKPKEFVKKSSLKQISKQNSLKPLENYFSKQKQIFTQNSLKPIENYFSKQNSLKAKEFELIKMNSLKPKEITPSMVPPHETLDLSNMNMKINKNSTNINIDSIEIPKSSVRELRDDEENYYFNEKNVTKFKPINEEQNNDNDKMENEILKPNKLLLFNKNQSFLSEILKEEINDLYKTENLVSLIILSVIYSCKTIAMFFWIHNRITNIISIIVLRSNFLISLFFLLMIRRFLYSKKWMKLPVFIIFSIAIITNLITMTWLDDTDCFEIEIIEMMIVLLIFVKMSVVYFIDSAIVFFLIFIIRVFSSVFAKSSNLFQNISLLMFACVMLMQSYSKISKLIRNFNNLNISNYRENQQKKLLMHLLPKHVKFLYFFIFSLILHIYIEDL